MKITTEKLSRNYSIGPASTVAAVNDVSFDVPSGESAAIVGPSGAGKSTLLHLIGLMDRPTGGKLFLEDKDASLLSDRERASTRRHSIGFLFQLHYLLPDFTVLENVLIPAWDRREEKKSDAARLLDMLGLTERAGHTPRELSGGEQQRVSLARALINGPALLLADEPTGNLDRETGAAVENLIFSECARRRITLILVTHNPELAARAGRIITMRDGKLAGARA